MRGKRKMAIFSEIYGVYFRIAAKVMARGKITENEIYDIIRNEGFKESALFLPQKLIPKGDGADWGLLKRNGDGKLEAVTENPPVLIMTELQKRWLKAKLYDPKIRLFLEDKEIEKLERELKNIKPLYGQDFFRFTDMFSDGDDFADENYRRIFRCVLAAVKDKEILDIQFTSGHGQRIREKYLPLKIEYSQKNDKFRVYCCRVKNGNRYGGGTINIGRIEEIRKTGEFFKRNISLNVFFKERRIKNPVTVQVSNSRNGVERFLAEFASYEKETERELKTGNITVKLYYDIQDETELLIRLLSFGPVLEIIGPENFRKKAAERVRRQAELLRES